MGDTRFEAVSLSFNIGNPFIRADICAGGTGCNGQTDCGGVSNDCNGPSCDGASCGGASGSLGLDARILVERSQILALRTELIGIVAKFTR